MGYPELAAGDAYKATLLLNLSRKDDSKLSLLVIDELSHDADVEWLLDSGSASTGVLDMHRAEVLQVRHDLKRSVLILLTQALLFAHSFAEANETFSKIPRTSKEDLS